MTADISSAPAEPRRILIVDIDEQVTSFLTFKLRRQHYEVLALTSTVNALAAIREFKPHLIVSEMVLPELSGVDFLKRIRMNPETAQVPFIFLSSSRNVEDKILAHEMGAEAFFAKPIFIKALINRINDLFQELDFKKMLAPAHEELFSGLLQNVSVMDLLNIVHENRRFGVIELTAPHGESGRIFFGEGAIFRVEKDGADNRQGEEILYALLPWDDGSFRIAYQPERPAVEPNIAESFEYLVLHATRWLSDYHVETSGLPAPDIRVHLRFPLLLEHLAKLPDSAGTLLRLVSDEGTSIGELMEKGGTDRRQTADCLKRLLSLGILADSPGSEHVTLPPLPAWTKAGSPHDTTRPAEQTRRWAPSPELPGDSDRSPRPLSSAQRLTAATPAPTPAAAPATAPRPSPERSQASSRADSAPAAASGQERPPAPSPDQVTPSSHTSDAALITELYQEHEAVKPPPRRTSLVPFAFITAVAAVGVALWYTLSGPGEKEKKTSLESTAAALPEAPDAAVTAPDIEQPPAPVENKDPLAGKKPEELIALGASAHTAERYDEAVAFYQAALMRLPKEESAAAPLRAKVLKNLAIVLYDTDRYDGALEAVLASRAIADDEAEKVDLTVAILEQMGRFDEAIGAYRAALKNKAFSPQAKTWKKEIARLKKEKRKAKVAP